jgi:hypothetical protein
MTTTQGAHGDVPTPEHRRPTGISDATVEALGKVSEALETVERARGHLYSFHQLTGSADLSLDEAVTTLHEAGHHEWAERITRELIGRNVVEGRWTFQIVEDYDDGYYEQFHQLEKALRGELVGGRRHLFEAEMKEERRTHGEPGHTATPPVEEPLR